MIATARIAVEHAWIVHSYSLGGAHVSRNIIYMSLGPPESNPKPVRNQFSRFCTAHQCDQHTDRHTDHAIRAIAYLFQYPA